MLVKGHRYIKLTFCPFLAMSDSILGKCTWFSGLNLSLGLAVLVSGLRAVGKSRKVQH